MDARTYKAFSAELLKIASEDADVKLFNEIKKQVPKGVTVVWDPKNKQMSQFGGGVYGEGKILSKILKRDMPKGDVIVVSRQDPAVLAHEMGHAKIDQSALGKLVQHRYVRAASTIGAPAGAVLSGYAAGSGLGPIAGALIGAAAPFLINSPVLVAEALASKKGVDALRRAGMPEAEIGKARATLLKAFGSYATLPTLGAIEGAVIGGMAGSGTKRR